MGDAAGNRTIGGHGRDAAGLVQGWRKGREERLDRKFKRRTLARCHMPKS